MSSSLAVGARHLLLLSRRRIQAGAVVQPHHLRPLHRCLGIRRKVDEGLSEPIPPGHTIDSVKPPPYWSAPPPDDPEPMAYVRKPVTSAHAVDVTADPPGLSTRDVATLKEGGGVRHGRYGDLDASVLEGIPLEYLALLHPAAEGAAAVRLASAKSSSGGKEKGTLLVYGASQPAGSAALQLAVASDLAAVGVVDGQHSGNVELVDSVKNQAAHPGTAVPEEYALVKANFRDLVDKTVHGDDVGGFDATTDFLPDFKRNVLDYAQAYPEGRPAVDPEAFQFRGKEKDREHFKDNMGAYLDQFPAGAPAIPPADLDKGMTKENYAAWRQKFNDASSRLITGEELDEEFEPPKLVKDMVYNPETPEEHVLKQNGSDFVNYEFSVLEQKFANDVEVAKGGPIVGAVIVATPTLRRACAGVFDGGNKSRRSKAEALQFLTQTERNAFAAASSVAKLATEAGAEIYVVGGQLPGLSTVEPTKDDVEAALKAMEVADDGSDSPLNFFLQVYRAGDFPIYESYAVHRATEAMSGPRQIIVTK